MRNFVKIFLIFLISSYGCLAKQWLSNANYYQIYPVSFMDSDGDGIGDLQGIKSKATYLKGLGMDGVWLSPIMASPMKDAGYDISDYQKVNPMFGTMTDLEEAIAEFKKQGLYLILDFVPNHTSDEHEWFQKSVANDPEYADYYIWHPGKPNPAGGRNLPPNNWVSVFRYSAWEWNDNRQAYYYHAFVPGQPDLNYRNPKVVEAMKNILRFWLDKGIAGFRIDAVPFLFEISADSDGNYKDEPVSGATDDPTEYTYLKHIYTNDQPETFEMAYQWRAVVDEYKDFPRVLLTEAYTSLENILKFYGDGVRNGSHVPFNFDLLSNLKTTSTAKDIRDLVENYMRLVPVGKEPNWVLGNHDNHRLATRLGVERADNYNMLIQTLPGNAVTYQGEELCMPNVYVTWADTLDPGACNTNETVYHAASRDPCRTPFPWSDSKNAGFSTADKTWLPAGNEYHMYNVAKQQAQSRSHLSLFKQLVQLKKTPVFQTGKYTAAANSDDKNLYAFARGENDNTVYVLLNYGKELLNVNLNTLFSGVPKEVKVLASTLSSCLNNNQEVTSTNVIVSASSGVILQYLKDSNPTPAPTNPPSTTTRPPVTTSTPSSTTQKNLVDKPVISVILFVFSLIASMFV